MAAKQTNVESVLSRVLATADLAVMNITRLFAAILMLYSGYVLYDTVYTNNTAFASAWDALQYKPEIIEDDGVPLSASPMAELSDDYRAWITIYDTNIDYPVMQGKDDLYYASHDYQGKSSLTGAIYLASSNTSDFSDSYNLLYGHHMDNAAMFGGIDNYKDASYFEGHRTGVLVTKNKVYDLDIFACVETDAYESNVYVVGNRDLANLINFIGNVPPTHAIMSAANGATKVIALSTCESAETNGRIVLFATMTERVVTSKPATTTTTIIPETPTTDPVNVPPTIPTTPVDPNPPVGTAASPLDPTTIGQNTETIENDGNPMASPFRPTGSSYGVRAWALVNLICLLMTIYLFLPLGHLKAKYRRLTKMRNFNSDMEALREADELTEDQEIERGRIIWKALELRDKRNDANVPADAEITEEEFANAVEVLFYHVQEFTKRLRRAGLLELVDALVALIAFVLTEDIRLPMVLIDRWTPLMLVLLAICWVIDVRLARYRDKFEDEDEESNSFEPATATA